MSAESLRRLQAGLIVSCQAPADSPLYEPDVIAAIAAAASLRGAVGVRIDTPAHIAAVRKRVSIPIIGLWKQVYADSPVYITPQWHHAQAVGQAGADLIAIDATQRPRPGGETLAGLIGQIHEQLGKPVLADVDSVAAAIAAVQAGADAVATTLYGYTYETQQFCGPGVDLLSQLVNQLSVPILCEGGISSPTMAAQAFARGAYAVVVGTDITGIDFKIQAYLQALPKDSSKIQ